MSVPLLSVEGLAVEFETRSGLVRALDDVTFSIQKGEILGIVGESGSGKSVLSYALMGLLDARGPRAARPHSVRRDGIRPRRGARSSKLRGRELSMIFQSPRTALNPIRKVGRQIEDVLVAMARPRAWKRGAPRSPHWGGCAFPIPSGVMTPIRSNCPAACVSA